MLERQPWSSLACYYFEDETAAIGAQARSGKQQSRARLQPFRASASQHEDGGVESGPSPNAVGVFCRQGHFRVPFPCYTPIPQHDEQIEGEKRWRDDPWTAANRDTGVRIRRRSSLPGGVMYEVTKASTVISHRAAVAFDCVADSQVAPLDTGIIGTFTQDSMVPSLKIS